MLEALNWRYAVKHFDPAKKLSDQQFNQLLEVLRLSPSSFGLQPWKFIVVNNPDIRKELQAQAWQQPQVVDASHLIVLCSLKDMGEDYIKKYVTDMAATRGVSRETLSGFEKLMLGFVGKLSVEERSCWMREQVYLALGMLLMACAQLRIDACPMEGFDPQGVEEVLELEKSGLNAVVLCPVGFRAANDKNAAYKKVRFTQKDVVISL